MGADHLGHVAQLEANMRCRHLHEESLVLFRQNIIAWLAVVYQAWRAALGEGTLHRRLFISRRARSLSLSLDNPAGMSWCLGLAGAAFLNENRNARIFMARKTCESLSATPAPAARATHERLMAENGRQLGV